MAATALPPPPTEVLELRDPENGLLLHDLVRQCPPLELNSPCVRVATAVRR